MLGVATGLGIAGKFMAPYAGKASIALARRVTYRRRIGWVVGKECDFEYPRRRFRGWLKTVSEAELSERVETAGPRLAIRLDNWLAADTSWSATPDRTSLALQLVEATYMAILRAADPALSRQLSEQWAKQRNEEMVAGLVQASHDIGRWTIAAGDLAVWLRRRSKERRRIRLAAFDVSTEAVALSLSAVDGLVPVIDPGSFRVLVGPFGAGKSEIAEHGICGPWTSLMTTVLCRYGPTRAMFPQAEGSTEPSPLPWVRARSPHAASKLSLTDWTRSTGVLPGTLLGTRKCWLRGARSLQCWRPRDAESYP
jgi:hypothetical protein